MMGLAAADGQACGYDAPRSGVEEARSPPGRGVVAAPSAPGRPQKTAIIPAKTANGSTRPGTRGRFSGARRRNRCCKAPISSMPWSVEKTPLKNTPSQADQHQYLRQQIHQHLHHHLCHHMAEAMFPSSVEKAVSPPRPNSEPREAANPSRMDKAHREAARA